MFIEKKIFRKQFVFKVVYKTALSIEDIKKSYHYKSNKFIQYYFYLYIILITRYKNCRFS